MQEQRNILLSGASGFIGSALAPFLEQSGYQVYRLVRRSPATESQILWRPGTLLNPANLPDRLHAIINLSGSSIAVPFSAANKHSILTSRVSSTSTLVQTVLTMYEPPSVFINASGVGYYGDCGEHWLNEDHAAGEGFVADVCVQWEAALAPLKARVTRTIALRTGLVLDPGGGALAKMLPAFRMGAGAILGDGRQYMSWISLQDYLRGIAFLLGSEDVSGPVNIASPNPVSNAEFSRSLATALHRPLLARAPAFALKLAMGEMARQLLLASQRVRPMVLENSGFQWENASLADYFDVAFGN
jgi:uncharacterized protein (TIGR01777 family)